MITRWACGLRSKGSTRVESGTVRANPLQSAHLRGNTETSITKPVKITSKGQVTIPLAIRSEFGLEPGTDVGFVAEAGRVILRAKRRRHDPVEAWLEESTGVSGGEPRRPRS